ncbi:hypothetical protein HK097_002541 [Rhizophlyctis rosea]|uniref:Uncharacterized protein n=1 Tax=Rhizophlyctis rosea TaxID=64517 RepID=A0AAD5WYD3_9FUNG|nr:hypothetical protein HK097_002541 [Rhizophlyctis rosea]
MSSTLTPNLQLFPPSQLRFVYETLLKTSKMAKPAYIVSIQWELQNEVKRDVGGVTVKYVGKPVTISPLHGTGTSVVGLLPADERPRVIQPILATSPPPLPTVNFTLTILPADVIYKIALPLSRIERSRFDKVCSHIHSSLDLIALEAARLVALPPSSEERQAVKANIYGKYPGLCNDFTSARQILVTFLASNLITKEDPAGVLGDACYIGDLETVKFILATCPADTLDNEFAFSTACQRGHVSIARLFLHKLPTNPAPNGRWPAHLSQAATEASAAGHFSILQFIFEETALRIDIEGTWMPRLLWNAAKNGHVEIVEYLLSKGAPPTIGKNVVSENKHTLPLIRALHSHGWDPREFNDTAMLEACSKSLIPVVQELSSYGVPLTTPSILTAAEKGDITLLEALLPLGLNTPTNLDAALTRATWSQNHDTCIWLLQHGADWVRSGQNALITRRENEPTTIEFVYKQSPTPIPLEWTLEALEMSTKYKYSSWIKPLFTLASPPGVSLQIHGEQALSEAMRWWDPSGVNIGRVLVQLGVSVQNSVAKAELESWAQSSVGGKKDEFLRLLVCDEEEVRRTFKQMSDDWIRGKQEARSRQMEEQGYATR